jgi:hypothetical protein
MRIDGVRFTAKAAFAKENPSISVFLTLFAVCENSRQKEVERGIIFLSKARDWLERDAKRKTPMTRTTDTQDRSFPYVLVCSTAATIISLASVWIATAVSYAPVMVA